MTIAAALLAVSLGGCGDLDLGAAPFRCHTNTPKCPDGYECKNDFCVKEGTCPDTVPGCNGEDNCGNGTCDSDEDNASCPEDCSESCGDGTCAEDEDPTSCPEDCQETGCGNGTCDLGEDHDNCPGDCLCGNDICDDGENNTNCPRDCAISCGNGTCDAGENSASCPQDCGGTSCGDGTCDPGEDKSSCPQDCTSACGDGTCDASEDATSCPKDCQECETDATECDGTDSLKSCENGVWKTETCEDLCVASNFDYATECTFSSSKQKDVCLCGNYVEFGGICDDERQCEPSMFCGVFGSSSEGFCTKYCNNPGGACSGAPYGTDAQCFLEVSGQDACGFDCTYDDCPEGLSCDYYSLLCKP